MKKLAVLLLLLLVLPAKADLPIEDQNVVSASGYNDYSFLIVADFTMKISGIADSNLTLYILSNESYVAMQNQAPFTSYHEQEVLDEYLIGFETGNYLDEYVHIVLSNFGESTVVYSILIEVVQDTTDPIGNSTIYLITILSFGVLTYIKRTSVRRSKIGKL